MIEISKIPQHKFSIVVRKSVINKNVTFTIHSKAVEFRLIGYGYSRAAYETFQPRSIL